MKKEYHKFLVLDIGGSSIKYAIMDETSEILLKNRCEVPKDIDSLILTICKLFDEIDSEVCGIAISMPGVIDSKQGIAHNGGALTYIQDYPFVKVLQEKCKVPVWIGNDAKCAAFAEVGYGNLSDVEDSFVVILGTGIGGCLIKDRKVHYGKHFAAGEFSNICVNNLNAYQGSSRWAVVNGIAGLSACVQRHLGEKINLTGEQIFEMANGGHAKVLDAITEFSENIAIQIFNIQAIFDAQKVAIGGGISAQPLLIQLIREKFDDIMNAVKGPVIKPEIVPCKYLNDANMVGALYQLLQMQQAENV